eukprot:421574-Pyramimonas_sp.AAC.1
MAYAGFFPRQDDHYFFPRGPNLCPGMPPEGKRLRLPNEGVQNDVNMRVAVERLKKAAPAKAPSGPAVSGSGSAPSGSAASENIAALGGLAVPSEIVAPSGPAASGSDSLTRAAQ